MATAIHAGHGMRREVQPYCSLAAPDRLREEDPHTDDWLWFSPNRIAVNASRFEVDLNRPRDRAVYEKPEDAWGLVVWNEELPETLVTVSRGLHDDFYRLVGERVAELVATFGQAVVFDLHSYNHRRGGPGAPPDDPANNPDINLGTESIDGARWHRLVAGVRDALASTPVCGRLLDVRENVRFRGGHFPRWLNGRFEGRVCAIAFEMKKIFMDEWTGVLDADLHRDIGVALANAADSALRIGGWG